MKAKFSSIHWGRVLLTGLVVVIILFLIDLALEAGFPQVPGIGFVASWFLLLLPFLLTVGGGIWIARQAERAAPLHGFLVGLVAALILLPINPDVTNFFQGTYRGKLDLLVRALVSFVLTVAAGWLGGVLGSRGRVKS